MKRTFIFILTLLLLLSSTVFAEEGTVILEGNRPLLKETILKSTTLDVRELNVNESVYPYARTGPIGISSQYIKPFLDNGFYYYPLAYNYLVFASFDGSKYSTFDEVFHSGKTVILPYSSNMDFVARTMALEYGSLSEVFKELKKQERLGRLELRKVKKDEFGRADQILILFEWKEEELFPGKNLTISRPKYGSGFLTEGILSPIPLDHRILVTPKPLPHYNSVDLAENGENFPKNLDTQIKRDIFRVRLYSPATPIEFFLSYTLFLPILCLIFVLFYYQVVRKKTRYYLITIILLLLFWIQVRMLKRFSIGIKTQRLFWYLYYIPFLFLPPFMYFTLSERRDDSRKVLTPKVKILTSVSSVLLVMVLTNSLHEQVFILFEDSELTDLYSYNWGYYLILAYCMSLIFATFHQVYIGAREQENPWALYGSFFILGTFIIYLYGYIKEIPFFRNSEIVLTEILFVVIFLIILLRTGIIQSNRGYRAVIENSPVSFLITDKDGKTMIKSPEGEPPDPKIFHEVTRNRLREYYINPTTRLNAYPISGGYFLWENDLRDVARRQHRLRTLNRDLRRETELLSRERALLEDLSEHLWQERIYEALDKTLDPDIRELERLIEAYEGMTEEQKTPARLAVVTIKAVCIKRKGNILLTGNLEGGKFTDDPISGKEIGYALNEFMHHVEAAQIPMEMMTDDRLVYRKAFALYLIGLFNRILEESLKSGVAGLFFNLFSMDDRFYLVLMVDTGKGSPKYNLKYREVKEFPMRVEEHREENTLTLRLSFPKEAVLHD